MKIEIRHLGAIEKASIDLKPLTVFIGENGTGKTWLAYTLEAIFGAYGHEQYLKAYLNKKSTSYPLLDQASEQFLKEGHTQLDVIQLVTDSIETYFNEVASLAPTWMPARMNTRRVTFEHLQVQIDLADMKSTLATRLMATSVNEKQSVINGSLNAVKDAQQRTLYFFSEGEILDKLPRQTVQQFLVSQLFHLMRKNIYSSTVKFSVERLNEKTATVGTESEKAERLLVELGEEIYNKLSNSDIPEAILKMLLGQIVAKANEPKLTNSPDHLSKYRRLAELLENDILRGGVDFEKSELGTELIFQAKNTQLEMSVSSSMIRELAPLVVYLRYHATPNSLIVFDEPEMNLHPAVQVELTEFLAMLVNAGLHVLITTHSPYIVDHLANLMQAAKHDNKETLKELFYLEQTDAFIPQEQVSIYLFEDGTTRNIVDDKGMIDWSTFGNVSSDVSDIYPQVISKLTE